jgi:hypothetical protein
LTAVAPGALVESSGVEILRGRAEVGHPHVEADGELHGASHGRALALAARAGHPTIDILEK